MQDKFVDLPDGRLHYLEGGVGEPLILLHSVGWSAHEFGWAAQALCERYRVIAWDMPGHGDSDAAPGHATLERHADTLAALLDALAIDRAHLLGVSIGGLLIVAFNDRHPGRARSLAIVEAGFQPDAGWAANWPLVEASFAIPALPREAVAPRFRALDDTVFQRWNIDRGKAGGRAMVGAMWALRAYRYEAALKAIATPTLLLYGDKSPVAACIPMLQGAIPGAELKILGDCGHFPMIDDPQAFNAAVLDFLDRN